MNKQKHLSFYRIEDANGDNAFLVPTHITLADLYKQVRLKQVHHKQFLIYYHFVPLQEAENGIKVLSDIVKQNPIKNPTFFVCDLIQDKPCSYTVKYGDGIVEATHKKKKYKSKKKKQFSLGSNGNVVYDGRQLSLMASSVNYASSKQQYIKDRDQIIENFHKTNTQQNKEVLMGQVQMGFFHSLWNKIRNAKTYMTPKNILNAIHSVMHLSHKENQKSENNEYSDFDPKFATYLSQIYIKYAIKNQLKLAYIQYKNIQDSIIKYQFPSNAKIAIIGDYGTGLSDSIQLLKHIVIEKQADIILHLGDVYYAGTPEEYAKNIIEPLNSLRSQIKKHNKRNVLFYSIPGNHDYYSWGMPFLQFLSNINKDQDNDLVNQKASYFCLRSQDKKWQFLGIDTAYHDSNPLSQINGFGIGPRLRHRQINWFIDKMETFPGSTILLSHHQLFSMHDRLQGSLTEYKDFSCINPLLSAQLFRYLPKISCWFWGHQHSLMFFDDNVFGVNKCRLLGNSSFHVFQKQQPYKKKQCFPHIPLIAQEKQYRKYLPLDPNNKDSTLYHLSYCFIDFSKQEEKGTSSTLQAQYYCCPCYPQSDRKNSHFDPYLLYKQKIPPRADLAKEKLKNGSRVYLKSEIGLYLGVGSILNLQGVMYDIEIIQGKNGQELQSGDAISLIRVKAEQNHKQEGHQKPIEKNVDQTSDQQVLKQIQEQQKQLQIAKQTNTVEGRTFIIIKTNIIDDQSSSIRFGDAFRLKQKTEGQSMSVCISWYGAQIKLKKLTEGQEACQFIFTSESKVKIS